MNDLDLKHITLDTCIKAYKHKLTAVIHNGEVVDFEKENGTAGR